MRIEEKRDHVVNRSSLAFQQEHCATPLAHPVDFIPSVALLAVGSINEPAMPLLHTTRLHLPTHLHLLEWYVG